MNNEVLRIQRKCERSLGVAIIAGLFILILTVTASLYRPTTCPEVSMEQLQEISQWIDCRMADTGRPGDFVIIER